MSSGFFLFKKNPLESFNWKVPAKYALNLLRLYLIWTAIYFFWIWKAISKNEMGIEHGFLLWIKNFFFAGSYIHLWYLKAMAVAVFIIIFMIKCKFTTKKILAIAATLYLIGLFGQSYFGILKYLEGTTLWYCLSIIGKIIVTTRNGVFEGFLFVGIGMLFAYCPIKMKYKNALIGFVASMLLMFLEAVVVQHLDWVRECDMYIFLVPATFFLFYLSTHIELKGNPVLYRELRIIGVLIFYIHLWIDGIIMTIGRQLGLQEKVNEFLITLLLSIVVAVAIRRISSCEKFMWIKRLYS